MRATPPKLPLPDASPRPAALADAADDLKLSNQLCFATYAAAHAFTRVYKPLLDPLGLTYPQYLVLLVLWEQENVTVREIGERLYLDSATLSPLLKRLETAGLVRRTRDARDERQVRITLTEAGRGLKGPVRQAWDRVVCAVGLPEAEFESLKRQLYQLRETLEASVTGADGAAPDRGREAG
jgi:DNA-binding MarR family transcriptional regulator